MLPAVSPSEMKTAFPPSVRLLAALFCLGAAAGHPAMPTPPPPPPASGAGHQAPSRETAASWFALARRRGLPENGFLLVVSVPDQVLYEIAAGGLRRTYRVSTARVGIDNRENSNGTPSGWHRVAARYGADALPGQAFVSRQKTAEVLRPAQWSATGGRDYVLTRILHLQGLEEGVNRGGRVDSFARCIYLHGTNQEQLLGTPASHGCIRLSNRDVMELFDDIAGRETYCWIPLPPR